MATNLACRYNFASQIRTRNDAGIDAWKSVRAVEDRNVAEVQRYGVYADKILARTRRRNRLAMLSESSWTLAQLADTPDCVLLRRHLGDCRLGYTG